jgi:F420-dependent oxidoreductase-like protein
MKIGVGLDTSRPIQTVISEAQRLADRGFGFLTSSHIFGYDAVTLLGVVGAAVPGPELMTAVVPIYTRHPLALAQQALTVQAATDGRFVLGIGLSHKMLIENVYGMSFEHPLLAMREYLLALMPLLRRDAVQFQGATVTVMSGPIEVDAPAPPVIVAALGPAMLELAGSAADGTATWMTGPKTLADHIVPTIVAAAERAGRPAPRVHASLPVCVTDDVARAREQANELFAIYGQLPSYRAMLDREGAATPADASLIGDEDAVGATLATMGASGVTHFAVAPFGGREEISRTMELFSGLVEL